MVFTDATLTALAERRPGRAEELIAIAGHRPPQIGLYGESVLALVAGATVDDVCPEKTFEISS